MNRRTFMQWIGSAFASLPFVGKVKAELPVDVRWNDCVGDRWKWWISYEGQRVVKPLRLDVYFNIRRDVAKYVYEILTRGGGKSTKPTKAHENSLRWLAEGSPVRWVWRTRDGITYPNHVVADAIPMTDVKPRNAAQIEEIINRDLIPGVVRGRWPNIPREYFPVFHVNEKWLHTSQA